MNNDATPEKIAKLPKWAQEHIEKLSLECGAAVAERAKVLDAQTPSDIYYGGFTDSGRKYVQSDEITFVIGIQMHGGKPWPTEISVRIHNGKLRLMGTGVCGTLQIIPHVSNVIEVGVFDR